MSHSNDPAQRYAAAVDALNARGRFVRDQIAPSASVMLRGPRWAIGVNASHSQSRRETSPSFRLTQGPALPSGPATWAIRLSSMKA